MRSKTKRNYKGGGEKEDCQYWVDSKIKKKTLGFSETQKKQCDRMSELITPSIIFDSGRNSWLTTQKPPINLNNDNPVVSIEDWNKIFDKQIKKPILSTSSPEQEFLNDCNQVRTGSNNELVRDTNGNLKFLFKDQKGRENEKCKLKNECNGYDTQEGANIYKNPSTDAISYVCNSSNLQPCKKWTSKRDLGTTDWYVTDINSKLCDQTKLLPDTDRSSINALGNRSDEYVNVTNPVPLKKPPLTDLRNVKLQRTPDTRYVYNGGKRSRRRTRKSRR